MPSTAFMWRQRHSLVLFQFYQNLVKTHRCGYMPPLLKRKQYLNFYGQNLVKTHMWAVHTHSSQWVYIHRRAHCQASIARAPSTAFMWRQSYTLWCCFSFARISWKRTSEFLYQELVEAYICYSLRNTLHVCYFYLVKIIFCDIK